MEYRIDLIPHQEVGKAPPIGRTEQDRATDGPTKYIARDPPQLRGDTKSIYLPTHSLDDLRARVVAGGYIVLEEASTGHWTLVILPAAG